MIDFKSLPLTVIKTWQVIVMASGEHAVQFHKKDFWSQENLKFTQPHFRLEKAARIVNKTMQGKECDLLDVGCGPAALQRLLDDNVHYYGIDIAIHDPAPNLIEMDFLESPIKFGDKQFDIILAQGVFEYVGKFQSQKFAEIREILSGDGKFIVSYVNFGHRKKEIYWPYSNVQSFNEFRGSLAQYFSIERYFPTSHNWNHCEPNRWWMKALQKNFNPNVPVISPILAVEYFFICTRPGSTRDRGRL
jgi:SAM-dependent methyltransferase